MSERFEGLVRDLSAKGLGVVDHPDGMVFFVEGTLPGERGEFEVTKRDKRYGFAKVLRIENESPARVKAPCPHQGYGSSDCHGCPWMIMNYAEQLASKQRFIEHTLNRNKLIETLTKIEAFRGSPNELAYRNRAQFKTNGSVLGFVAADEEKKIVDIKHCLILSEKNQNTLAILREKLPNPEWNPGEGFDWNFIEIDDDLKTSEIQLNKKRPFKQANDTQNGYMREWLGQQLDQLDRPAAVLELFCGSGNFTEIIAKHPKVKRTCAIEASKESILALKEKRLPNCDASAGDLFKIGLVNRIKQVAKDCEVLVLDPPRAGFRHLSRVTETLHYLKKIIYISCDLPTFSYDAKMIQKQGWKLSLIQGIDQFPHTPHIEVLSVFTK